MLNKFNKFFILLLFTCLSFFSGCSSDSREDSELASITVSKPKYIKSTLQNSSYDENATEILDQSLKDDGYYQTGTVPNYTRASDMVTDELTGLMWQDSSDVEDLDNKKTQPDGVSYCSSLVLGGYSDWRLPSRGELVDIVDYTHSPSIHPDFVYIANSLYWTITKSRDNLVYSISFDTGSVFSTFDKDNFLFFVRCVREGDSL